MKQYDLIIKNGTVVTTTDMYDCDIAVKDGKIVAMEADIAPERIWQRKSVMHPVSWCCRELLMYIPICRCRLEGRSPQTAIFPEPGRRPAAVSPPFLIIRYSMRERPFLVL